MVKILRKLSFALASSLYSLIPDLYDIFYKLSCATYIDQETIRGLSRNVYVIISACMLFALGIRLLTAIVNPDSFNDNKKGAKRTFMNCIIAVLLIAVVPIGFEKAYDVQHTLVGDEESGENSLITALFLGKQISSNDSIGEILAKQSFVTFCYPNDYRTEDVTDAFNNLTDNYYSGDLEIAQGQDAIELVADATKQELDKLESRILGNLQKISAAQIIIPRTKSCSARSMNRSSMAGTVPARIRTSFSRTSAPMRMHRRESKRLIGTEAGGQRWR